MGKISKESLVKVMEEIMLATLYHHCECTGVMLKKLAVDQFGRGNGRAVETAAERAMRNLREEVLIRPKIRLRHPNTGKNLGTLYELSPAGRRTYLENQSNPERCCHSRYVPRTDLPEEDLGYWLYERVMTLGVTLKGANVLPPYWAKVLKRHPYYHTYDAYLLYQNMEFAVYIFPYLDSERPEAAGEIDRKLRSMVRLPHAAQVLLVAPCAQCAGKTAKALAKRKHFAKNSTGAGRWYLVDGSQPPEAWEQLFQYIAWKSKEASTAEDEKRIREWFYYAFDRREALMPIKCHPEQADTVTAVHVGAQDLAALLRAEEAAARLREGCGLPVLAGVYTVDQARALTKAFAFEEGLPVFFVALHEALEDAILDSQGEFVETYHRAVYVYGKDSDPARWGSGLSGR